MTIRYSEQYGTLEVNLETQWIDDNLNRDLIWSSSNEDYSQQSIIYSQILDWMGIAEYAHPIKPNQIWNGEETDLGFKAILDNGNELLIDSEGTFFMEQSSLFSIIKGEI